MTKHNIAHESLGCTMLNLLFALAFFVSTTIIVAVRLHFFGGLSSPRGRKLVFISGAVMACCVYVAVQDQKQKAIAAGFENSQDRRDAKKAGFSNPEAWKAEKLKRSSQSQK
ncbi:hypothetical protein AB4Y85_18120 [Microvirga sp. 2YAF29]|uniref:hypothetical protein n=1 Tax=Microvirga sp. 2YAF29 TaxID=3233031 RepID=UPI003F96F41C